jgi:hypothetical protein
MINITQLNISVDFQAQYSTEYKRRGLKHGSYGGIVLMVVETWF